MWRKKADPYYVWVSEIMLQQTVIKAVIPAYERFMRTFPTVSSLAQASEEEVRTAVRGLGYYRRFRFLHEAAKVVEKNQCEWPETFDAWKTLPGIGEYTASAIASIAFNEPVAVVDGNVERVLCRLLDLQVAPNAPGLKPEFKALAQAFLDPSSPGDFNQAMMELGQLACTVTSPSCASCPLSEGCLARERGTQSLAPRPKERVTPVPMTLRLGIIREKNNFALVERPEGAKFLKKSWGFLTGIQRHEDHFEWDSGSEGGGLWEKVLNQGTPLPKQAKHTITHHKITIQVLPIDLQALKKADHLRWIPLHQVEESLLSNLDRKAWRLFLRESHGSL